SYPTGKIAVNSEDYRPLGLGYANLGALLMAQGTAYDSDEGRSLAGAITAIMTGAAYRQSARIAAHVGPFNGYAKNREPMLRRIGYTDEQAEAIIEYIVKNDCIEGAPGLLDEHLPVFDCAFKAMSGTRSIHHMGHVKMMAAAQPFISGAISKTVNMPSSSDA